MGVSNPVSRDSKTQFLNIPSQKSGDSRVPKKPCWTPTYSNCIFLFYTENATFFAVPRLFVKLNGTDFPDSVLKEIRPERCGPFRQDPNWVFHKILYWKHTLPRNFTKHQSGYSLKPSPFSQCQTQTGPCCCPSNHILWVWQVRTSCCLFTQE